MIDIGLVFSTADLGVIYGIFYPSDILLEQKGATPSFILSFHKKKETIPTMLLEMNHQSLFSFFLSLSLLVHQARAHGYLASPRSRNFVAHQDGLGEKKAPVPGVPYVEYCHACLTRNAGVCGLSIHDHNYDDWLDSTGSPMPWNSQATYEQGGIVRINTIIKAHHLGHIEVSACPDGRASTQECFDQHRLTFIQDIAHGMPADPKHPERGYLSLGEEFSMDFKLPDNVSGDNVLLQVSWDLLTRFSNKSTTDSQ